MEVEAIVKAIVVCSLAFLVIVLFVCHVRLSVMGEQLDTFLDKLTRRDQITREQFLEIKNRLDDIQDSIQTPREYILTTRKEEKQ